MAPLWIAATVYALNSKSALGTVSAIVLGGALLSAAILAITEVRSLYRVVIGFERGTLEFLDRRGLFDCAFAEYGFNDLSRLERVEGGMGLVWHDESPGPVLLAPDDVVSRIRSAIEPWLKIAASQN
ncbi:MAG: hypothetical protein JST40_05790 [Armatimonadetes bacterium]|nr:hypothetical protein [Armatimonadota bacterium]